MTANELNTDWYRQMRRLRTFEDCAVSFAQDGLVPGFTHSSAGQEAVAVGVCSQLRAADRVATTHRGHGHILAKGAEPGPMLAEILGKVTGSLRGMGGELHILDTGVGVIGANGIVGAGVPIAVGAALADSLAARDTVTVVFFGDGAINEGVVAEALNLAAIWTLPVVFVCENNLYSEFTPTADVSAGNISDRAIGYALPGVVVDGQDVAAVAEAAATAIDRARGKGGPSLIEARTYRFHGHFFGEEALLGTLRYRSRQEVEEWRSSRDPVALERSRLLQAGIAAEELDAIDAAAAQEIERASAFAKSSAVPEPDQALEFVFIDSTVGV